MRNGTSAGTNNLSREEQLRELRIKAELDPNAELCPRCGGAFLIPTTIAAEKYGVCEICYQKALAEAHKEELRLLNIKRERQSIRQARRRARESIGASLNNEPIKPNFEL